LTEDHLSRRTLLTAGAALATVGLSRIVVPAQAQGVAPTTSMRGGSNNYRPGAPIVDRIGNGGFWMTGTVRRAGDGAPLAGQRIQIWAHTTEGHERDPQSHGATLTDANGEFRLEMPQIVPALVSHTGTWPMIAVSLKLCFFVRSCQAPATRAFRPTSCCNQPSRARLR
jgi:protocatechuate 3,4-dioxygenase beta subunit